MDRHLRGLLCRHGLGLRGGAGGAGAAEGQRSVAWGAVAGEREGGRKCFLFVCFILVFFWGGSVFCLFFSLGGEVFFVCCCQCFSFLKCFFGEGARGYFEVF